MSFKKILGTLSPIYGMATGEGLFGNAIGTSADNKTQDDKIKALEAEVAAGKKTQQQAEMEAKGTGMKKGGKVSSASKRADGIAVKGKTRGRIV